MRSGRAIEPEASEMGLNRRGLKVLYAPGCRIIVSYAL